MPLGLYAGWVRAHHILHPTVACHLLLNNTICHNVMDSTSKYAFFYFSFKILAQHWQWQSCFGGKVYNSQFWGITWNEAVRNVVYCGQSLYPIGYGHQMVLDLFTPNPLSNNSRFLSASSTVQKSQLCAVCSFLLLSAFLWTPFFKPWHLTHRCLGLMGIEVRTKTEMNKGMQSLTKNGNLYLKVMFTTLCIF